MGLIKTRIDPLHRQVLTAVASGFHTIGQMAIWGMSSVRIVDENDDPILSSSMSPWFASLPLVMAIPGATIGGMLTDCLGPRKFQMIMAPVLAILLVLMQLASWDVIRDTGFSSTTLLVVRGIQSIATGSILSAVCQYPCETADTKHRGFLGSLVDLFGYIGFTSCYITNYFWHWTTITWIIPLFSFLPSFLLLLLICPESPIWLIKRGKEMEALEALYSLRSSRVDAQDELSAMRDEHSGKDIACLQSMSLLTHRRNTKPMLIAAFLPMFRELGGNVTFAFFMIDFFRLAGVNLNPNLCSSIAGSIRILSNLIGSFLLHRTPRKKLLLPGLGVVIIAEAVLGGYYFMKANGTDVAHINWLPLFLTAVVMIGYGISIGNPTWLIAAEILPNSIRSVGCGIVFTVYAATAFFTTLAYSYLRDIVGMYTFFWVYSGSFCVYAIYLVVIVPETYGLSLSEIEAFW